MAIKDVPAFLKRSPIVFSVANGELNPVVKHWMLQLLVPMSGMRDFVRGGSFRNDNIAEALGLHKWLAPEDEEVEFDRNKVIKDLRRMYKLSSDHYANAQLPSAFVDNIAKVADLVGLSSVDCRVLEFAVLVQMETLLNETADFLGNLSSVKIIQVLSSLLGIEEAAIRESLHPDAILAKSGLLSVERNGSDCLPRKLDILSQVFADTLYSVEAEPIQLLRDTVIKATPSNIGISDYQQINKHLDILIPYIKACMKSRKPGVNILLYGLPGVGKTQLAKVIAELVGTDLFEISSEDCSGDPVDGKQRLASYRAGQYFLGGRQCLLVFDEAEDIFASGGFFSPRSIAETRKAWMNRILEENPVPTFWLSNSIHDLDPAFIRRFDMKIEVILPGRKQRTEILQKQCGDFIDAKVIRHIAEADNLAPAVTERAVNIIRAVKDELTNEQLTSSLELLINTTLETQGHKPLGRYNANKVPEVYDPAFIHADANLIEVAEGLAIAATGRLCLYGPPGTGKTAYGKWLAEKLEKPLLVRRGSDLLSMWVGGTEKNIAKAFAEAESEDAILLIDEVDSFLQDRRGASKSWEVTAVNEMLTQMETYPGIFIASTNLMTGLDQAALRRFDLKVKFDFMKPEQAWQLFLRHCQKLQLEVDDESLSRKLYSLNNLTPGDFAAVARQNSFRPLKSAFDLVLALEGESAIKEGAPGKGIGFLRH